VSFGYSSVDDVGRFIDAHFSPSRV
jgi:hypothetical protein